MRVIAGERKGLKLKVPKHAFVRPTEDKVKESLFNILMPLKENAVILDLFSCSGSIGIEFLSRGAERAVLADVDYESIRIIKQNIEKTRYEERAEIVKGTFKKVLKSLALGDGNRFDYIYLDPPYEGDMILESLEHIMEYRLLDDEGIIIAESDRDIDISSIASLEEVDHRKYGRVLLSFYQKIRSEP